MKSPTAIQPIDGVIVCMLASNAVVCGYAPRLGQANDYKIGICCFFAKHIDLRRKSKYCLAQNQNNEWGHIRMCWSSSKWISSLSH